MVTHFKKGLFFLNVWSFSHEPRQKFKQFLIAKHTSYFCTSNQMRRQKHEERSLQ